MAQTHEIRIEKHSYLPKNQSIAKGDTVTWLNNDPDNHTITADDGSFDSGQLESKQTFSHTFDAEGMVAYHCKNHKEMKGTITVEQKGQTHSIDIKEVDGDMGFDPASKSVAKGDTVVWTNRMDFDHTVTADDGGFDSKIGPNGTFSHTFDTAGTFNYRCRIHPFMRGTITVD
jgi:plastocyanin